MWVTCMYRLWAASSGHFSVCPVSMCAVMETIEMSVRLLDCTCSRFVLFDTIKSYSFRHFVNLRITFKHFNTCLCNHGSCHLVQTSCTSCWGWGREREKWEVKALAYCICLPNDLVLHVILCRAHKNHLVPAPSLPVAVSRYTKAL